MAAETSLRASVIVRLPMLAATYFMPPAHVWALTLNEFFVFLDDFDARKAAAN